jgi:hypothetical protein
MFMGYFLFSSVKGSVLAGEIKARIEPSRRVAFLMKVD